MSSKERERQTPEGNAGDSEGMWAHCGERFQQATGACVCGLSHVVTNVDICITDKIYSGTERTFIPAKRQETAWVFQPCTLPRTPHPTHNPVQPPTGTALFSRPHASFPSLHLSQCYKVLGVPPVSLTLTPSLSLPPSLPPSLSLFLPLSLSLSFSLPPRLPSLLISRPRGGPVLFLFCSRGENPPPPFFDVAVTLSL